MDIITIEIIIILIIYIHKSISRYLLGKIQKYIQSQSQDKSISSNKCYTFFIMKIIITIIIIIVINIRYHC